MPQWLTCALAETVAPAGACTAYAVVAQAAIYVSNAIPGGVANVCAGVLLTWVVGCNITLKITQHNIRKPSLVECRMPRRVTHSG
jgi:hypothetical protein